MKIAIIKLGGGLITQKRSNSPNPRIKVIARIARELFYVCKKRRNLKFILLHGAGSFGHQLVFKHKLSDRKINSFLLPRAAEVTNSLRQLGSLIAAICLKAGLPIIPLQTSSIFFAENKKLLCKNSAVLETILKHGGIPLLGGDLLLDNKGFVKVVSADNLAVFLAKRFKNSQVFFAANVDGVYENFPSGPNQKPLSRLNRQELQGLIQKVFAKESFHRYDVSGGMAGKLKKILQLRNRKVVIFNGIKPGLLKKALLGKENIGTAIFL